MPNRRERKLKKNGPEQQQNPVENTPIKIETSIKINNKTSLTGAEITEPIKYEDPVYYSNNTSNGIIGDKERHYGEEFTYTEIGSQRSYLTESITTTTTVHNTGRIQEAERRLNEISPNYKQYQNELKKAKENLSFSIKAIEGYEKLVKNDLAELETTEDPVAKAQLQKWINVMNNYIKQLQESSQNAQEAVTKYENYLKQENENPEINYLVESLNELYASRQIAKPETDQHEETQENFIGKNYYERKIYIDYKKDFLDLETLKDFYNNNGKDANKTYQFLLDFIKENKDNQDVLQHTISSLLSSFNNHYDKNKNFVKPADNIVDTFEKILKLDNEEEKLKGFMCSSIHSTMMQVLNDCGFETVIITGSKGTADLTSNHATLLYKNTNNEYVFCDYGKSSKIKAPTITDAIKEIHKNSGILQTNGFITIMDKNNTYKRFELENVAAWGKELADRELMQMPGINPIAENTIRGDFEQNADGKTFTAGVTIVNQNMTKATSIDIQGKKTGESDIFNNSESFGIKYNTVKNKPLSDNTILYSNNSAILTYTTGQNSEKEITVIKPEIKLPEITPTPNEIMETSYTFSNNINNENVSTDIRTEVNERIITQYTIIDEKKTSTENNPTKQEDIPISSYLGTGQYQEKFGLKTEIVDTPKLNIKSISELETKAHLTAGNGCDGIISSTVTQGVEIDSKLAPELSVNGNLSGGLTGEFLNRSNYQGMHLQTGFKGVAGVGLNWRPNQTLDLATSLSGGIITDATSTTTGLNIWGQISYTPGENTPTIFANGKYTNQQEQLELGNFNETVKNNNSLEIQLGTKFNNNSQLSIAYEKYKDNIHPNQNSKSWLLSYIKTF